MSDASWTDILQTVALLAALLFTGWEIRARTREQQFRNYLDAISGFVHVAGLMVEKPELHGLYAYSPTDLTASYADLSSEQKTRVHYCDTIIALCETVWLAGEQGWLAAEEWLYWKRWARDLQGSPEFRWTLDWVRAEYDEPSLRRCGVRPWHAVADRNDHRILFRL